MIKGRCQHATNQRRKAFSVQPNKCEENGMKLKLIALASAAMIGLTAVAIPNEAEARWRGGGWWIPGAVVGGLALGAAIASRPYYYGPGYYSYGYDPYYYGGGYAPSYYSGGYAPYYGGGYYQQPYPYNRYRHWSEY
jgi:hypothetical protein